MTGEQLYELMDTWVHGVMADIDPRERHKHKGAIIRDCCRLIHAYVPPELARDFEAAMTRHSY